MNMVDDVGNEVLRVSEEEAFIWLWLKDIFGKIENLWGGLFEGSRASSDGKPDHLFGIDVEAEEQLNGFGWFGLCIQKASCRLALGGGADHVWIDGEDLAFVMARGSSEPAQSRLQPDGIEDRMGLKGLVDCRI
jgi:hypothetical protein